MTSSALPAGDGLRDPAHRSVVGPALSTVLQRLQQAPADFVLEPGTAPDATALVVDILDLMAPGPQRSARELTEIRRFFNGPDLQVADLRSRAGLLTAWVLLDPAVHDAPALVDAGWAVTVEDVSNAPDPSRIRLWRSAAVTRWALTTIVRVSTVLAPVLDPSLWTSSNASREEAARAIVRAGGMHPAYETEHGAEARWQSVSTAIQQQVIAEIAVEARRAEILAAALRSKAAKEAAAQISHV